MAWFKVDDGFYTSRKVLSIPRRHRLAAVGLWTMAGNWSARELTDGKVPTFVLDEIGATETLIRALVEARLWLDHRSTEPRPDDDHASTGIEFVNWSEYQPTRASVEAERAAARERQRKRRRNQRSGQYETEGSQESHTTVTPASRRDTTVSHGGSHTTPTRPDPTRINKDTSEASTEARPDVERICNHLADRIEANGSKRPRITRTWRDEARRLIDLDGRTEEQITRAIDWAQDHPFWRSNILSMPKLRAQYDTLRLQAERETVPQSDDAQYAHDLWDRLREQSA